MFQYEKLTHKDHVFSRGFDQRKLEAGLNGYASDAWCVPVGAGRAGNEV